MKNIGIIIFGEDQKLNYEKALNIIIDYVSSDSQLDKCDIEKYVMARTFPNLLYITKKDDENEISIEDSRKIIEFLSQKPMIQGKRAVFIESVEDMSRSASNAILKVLEEPPHDAIIVMTTTKICALLPTIRSRCIQIRTNKSVKIENPVDYIKQKLKNIDPNFIDESIRFIKSGCKDSCEFAKKHADNAVNFLEIAIAVFGLSSSKNKSTITANKVIQLQDILNLARKTYPDKTNLIIAATLIIR